MNDKNKSGSGWAFLAGLLTGAAAVFLLGTDEGKRMTAKIKKAANNFLESLETELEETQQESIQEPPSLEPDKKNDLGQAAKTNIEYIKDLQNRGRIFGRRFFKRH